MRIIPFMAVAILMTSAILFGGCKKEGCTDPDSVNFDVDANKDDGSCAYEGSLVFWWGQNAAIGLQNDGATSLSFYIDGALVGSSGTNVYWSDAPNCGVTGSVSITMDLGDVTAQTYNYKVRDQTAYTYWAGTVTLEANQCWSLELDW